jgi:hypothetical protein
MKVDYAAIDELFRLYDIDGLISSGAPEDEYDLEVEPIVAALEMLPQELASVTSVANIFEVVWTQMCGGSEEQKKRRRFDFQEIAERVVQYFG